MVKFHIIIQHFLNESLHQIVIAYHLNKIYHLYCHLHLLQNTINNKNWVRNINIHILLDWIWDWTVVWCWMDTVSNVAIRMTNLCNVVDWGAMILMKIWKVFNYNNQFTLNCYNHSNPITSRRCETSLFFSENYTIKVTSTL